MDHFKALRTIVRTADEGGLAAATRDVRGHLRVLAPPAFVVHQLARRLPDFRRAHPQAPGVRRRRRPQARLIREFRVG